MNVSPLAVLGFFAVFVVVAVLSAYGYNRAWDRFGPARVMSGGTQVAVVVLTGVGMLSVWDDPGAATSAVHHRLYLAALAVLGVTVFVSLRLRPRWPRLRGYIALCSAALCAFALGLSVGTTDWAAADLTGDHAMRLLWPVMLVFMQTGSVIEMYADAPPPPANRTNLRSVRSGLD